jgi:PAS domain S-box-containing protein
MEYNRDEVIGRTAKELNIWIDEGERQWIINEIHEKGNVYGKVIRYRTRTGKLIYGLSSMSVVNVNGESCNLSTVVNITESKEADLKLIESEELFRKLFENMLNGFAYCKMIHENGSPPDFLYISVNKSFTTHTGLKDVMGKRASEAIPGIQKSDPELLERYDRVSSTGIPEVFEIYVESLKMWFSISVYCPQKGYFVAVFDVITARKLAEEKLKQNEITLHSIIDNSNSLIYLVDSEGRFVMANKHLQSLFALPVEKLIGQAREAFMPKDIAFLHRRNDMEVFSSGKTQMFEEENIEPDGKHYYLTTKFPLYNSENKIYAVGGLSTDITERKNIEKTLTESEERFRSLYENVTIGIYRTTIEGRILMANPALVSMLGFDSFEQLKTRNLEQEGYEPDYSRSKFLKTIDKEGKIIGLESAWKRQDGSTLFIRESAKAIEDADGRLLYYDGTVEDITDRKKAEEALLESEDKFKYVFDHSVIGKSITTPSGEINVNQSFCDMLGYTREELEKTKWQDISHPDDIELAEKTLKSILSGKSDSARFRKRYIHKNRNIVWTDVGTALRRDEHGNPLYFLTSVMDITDRKNAEEMILQLNEELEQKVIHRTELLEAANKELEAFSYSVSHDLRAPLRSVHGYTKILLEEYENRLDEEGKRICGIISSSATQMGELIDDLLSFSRIGRTSMNISLLDMRAIVYSVFEEISTPDEKARTTFKVGRLHKAFGDANLLKLVWTNLISNAIKYSSKETISEISIGSQIRYDRITYSVKDNGVGFNMNYKHKLFGVFQRLHSESEFEGNGVGLAIVQRIVLKHSGKVWAEGEEGKGATFYFSLPVQDVNKK